MNVFGWEISFTPETYMKSSTIHAIVTGLSCPRSLEDDEQWPNKEGATAESPCTEAAEQAERMARSRRRVTCSAGQGALRLFKKSRMTDTFAD